MTVVYENINVIIKDRAFLILQTLPTETKFPGKFIHLLHITNREHIAQAGAGAIYINVCY